MTLRHRDEAVDRLPPQLALIRWPARPPPRPNRRCSIATPPAFCWCRGHPINEPQLALLHQEAKAYLASRNLADHVYRTASLFLVLTLLSVLVILYVIRFQPALVESLGKILAFAGWC